MPYDNSLDEKLFSESWDFESGRITVSVFSYNKGTKKMQISRETKDTEGNFRFAKLGRLFKEEIENILPLIQKALDSM